MTTCPEAFLAREAEICFTTMSHITDYDVWHESEEPVTVEMVIETMHHNLDIAQQAIADAVEKLDENRVCTCHTALDNAILSDRSAIPAETLNRLRPIVGRLFT